jgi:arylesterase/paraoxonase
MNSGVNRRLRSRRGLMVMAVVAIVVFVGRILWANGLFSSVPSSFFGTCKVAAQLPGVEDIETANGVTFVSVASARGPDARDGIYILSDGGNLTRLPGAPTDFHPRGIGIYRSPDGTGIFLLAVNRHAGRSATGASAGSVAPAYGRATADKVRFSIDSFEVTNPKTNPALVAQGTIRGGLLTDPQDVAAAGPGAFYVSNGTSGSSFVGSLAGYGVLPGSNILYFNGMSFRSMADDIYGARGLLLTPDGSHLLVASLTSRSLKSLTREPFSGNLTEAGSLALPMAPEKITLDSTGQIWAAGHASLFAWRNFAADAAKRAPSQVLRITMASGLPQQSEQVYGNDGSEIAAASVAALAGRQLMIGSSLDGRFLICTQK